jgi:hypothetical protein
LGCEGLDGLVNKPGKDSATETEEVPSTGTKKTKETKKTIDPVLLNSPAYQEFSKEFDERFPDYISLPKTTLFQIIEAVPEQGETSWSCGNIQSGLVRASASLAVSEPIDKASLSRCNIVDDYPLLVDIVLPESVKALLKTAGYKLKLDTDDHFRVGAVPHQLPAYLNSENRLPKSIRAKHVKKDTLTKDALLAEIDQALAIEMPLIALYVINADDMQLHYYGIAGYDKNKEDILLLETDGKGIDRLITKNIDSFLAHLDTKAFKKRVRTLQPVIEGAKLIYNVTGKIPTISDLDGVGIYNLITFDKLD